MSGLKDSLDKVVKSLQQVILYQGNCGGEPNTDLVIGYTEAIRLINEGFGTKYASTSLYGMKVKDAGIWEKLPLDE